MGKTSFFKKIARLGSQAEQEAREAMRAACKAEAIQRFLVQAGVTVDDDEFSTMQNLVAQHLLGDAPEQHSRRSAPPRDPEAEKRSALAPEVPDILAKLYAESVHQKRNAAWCKVDQFIAEYRRLTSAKRMRLSDDEQVYLDLLLQVARSGLARRPLALPDPSSVLGLQKKFPNFAAPVQLVAEQLALACFSKTNAFHINPMLLVGPPGVGKTLFAHEMAKILGTKSHTLNMSALTCGFALSGMTRGWSAAAPGLVFKSLLDGDSDRILIIVDEIEKANHDSKSDPTGPLFSLLEPGQAARFRDEHLGFDIDASKMIWIATANDLRGIDAALLSRLTVCEIPEPTISERRTIMGNLLAEAVTDLAFAPEELPSEWAEPISRASPRELRHAIRTALGRAALRARQSGASVISLQKEDFIPASSKARRPIGFIGG